MSLDLMQWSNAATSTYATKPRAHHSYIAGVGGVARRATDNGVTVATGLTVQPFEESGYHVMTTAEVSANQTLFAVPVDVAVRVDSQHTDFGSVFAAELEAGWWTPEKAGAADELHVVALVLYVQVAGCAYASGNAVEALGFVGSHACQRVVVGG